MQRCLRWSGTGHTCGLGGRGHPTVRAMRTVITAPCLGSAIKSTLSDQVRLDAADTGIRMSREQRRRQVFP